MTRAKIIRTRYDLLEMLGAGGMGTVYRARDRELDEVVALKVIRGDLARQDAMVEQFRHEVKLARSADGQRLQQVVRLRAESILDALYGDS